MGNGSCQSLIARANGGDLHQGTEWGAERGRGSCKQSGVCVLVKCRGGVVEGKELDPNPMPFFFLFFFYFFFIRL